MTNQYIAYNYSDMRTASGKAKIDAEDIVVREGYKNVGTPRTHNPIGWRSYVSVVLNYAKAVLSMESNGIVFLQYPTPWCLKHIRLAKKRRNKVIVLIHDLNLLRNSIGKDEMAVLQEANLLIVHTPAMRDFLIKKRVGKNHVILGCFDYLNGSAVSIPAIEDGYNIAFTGNLGKSIFLDKVKLKKNRLHLYGIGIENRNLPVNVEYKGCFPPEKLAENMSEHFGLVWDGDSVSECSGQLGEYLRLIAPHKFSMYLSAGLPVIVWEESALAPFVIENKIGLTVSSLADMEQKLSIINKGEYEAMIENVGKIRGRLLNGNFLIEALQKSITTLQSE